MVEGLVLVVVGVDEVFGDLVGGGLVGVVVY